MSLWLESARLALAELKAHKLRTFLTLLGNIIGVMFVIAILSVTQGMNRYVSEKLLDQGSNVFWVERIGMVTSWDEWVEKNKRKPIEMSHLGLLQELGTKFGHAGGVRSTRTRVKHRNHALKGVLVLGVSADHPEAQKYPLEAGRHLAEADVDHRRPVAVIGHEVKNELFPGEDPMGKELRVGSSYYTVVGIVEKKGSLLGESQDNLVAVPLSAYEKQFGTEHDLSLSIQALDQGSYLEAQDEARTILRMARKVPTGRPDDFDLLTSEMFMQLYNTMTAGAYMTMVILAGIALVVGGIVIMNIMLVSVTERTREIGIRKAIGARRSDILRQFLIEAVVLGGAGGVLGVLLGAGLALIVDVASPLPAVIQPWVVILGLSVASFVGLFFGVWPALKAAKLDPIVALRYE
jgi:putative ABC transport system permease protein